MDLHTIVSKVKELAQEIGDTPTRDMLMSSGISDYSIRINGGFEKIVELAGMISKNKSRKKKVKILVLDIETAPIEAKVWGLFDQNIGLNQVIRDWFVMAWAAKWVGSKKIFYRDQRNATTLSDDRESLRALWDLMNEADIVITQNGKKFDIKKLNSRFLVHDFGPVSPFRQLDTKELSKKIFGHISNRLEYMSHTFNVKYKKLKHGKFPGFELWIECEKGNPKAWREMEKYNKHDVLSTEEYCLKILPFDTTINFDVFQDDDANYCSCGGTEFTLLPKEKTTNTARYALYRCNYCKAIMRGRENLIDKDRRKIMRRR